MTTNERVPIGHRTAYGQPRGRRAVLRVTLLDMQRALLLGRRGGI